jgi:hypothetical protein
MSSTLQLQRNLSRFRVLRRPSSCIALDARVIYAFALSFGRNPSTEQKWLLWLLAACLESFHVVFQTERHTLISKSSHGVEGLSDDLLIDKV